MTGSHNVKVGVMLPWGTYRRYNNANADLYQTYQNGVPLQVTVLNTPLEVQENLDANSGVYAQDSWSFAQADGQLRPALGLRRSSASSASRRRSAASPTRRRTTTSSCRCGATSRRALSVVYDLFGNGKTAVRAGFNKFMTAATTGFAQLYNPTAL